MAGRDPDLMMKTAYLAASRYNNAAVYSVYLQKVKQEGNSEVEDISERPDSPLCNNGSPPHSKIMAINL